MSPRRRTGGTRGNGGSSAGQGARRNAGDRPGRVAALGLPLPVLVRRTVHDSDRVDGHDRKVLAGNRALRKILRPALGGVPVVQRAGTLIDWHTVDIGDGAGTLHHVVGWGSSTGNTDDLAHIATREHIEWDAAPAALGMEGEYAGAGEHFGLGSNLGSSGSATDDHTVFPPGINLDALRDVLDADGTTPTWMMTQHYQMKVGDADWQDIPGAEYEITRWFERQGDTLVAYAAKRGLTDSVMHRSMVNLDNFFR